MRSETLVKKVGAPIQKKNEVPFGAEIRGEEIG